MGRTIKESSSNEEDEVFLKASFEEDEVEVTKQSNTQIFKISAKFVEENYKLKKLNLDFKEYF